MRQRKAEGKSEELGIEVRQRALLTPTPDPHPDPKSEELGIEVRQRALLTPTPDPHPDPDH